MPGTRRAREGRRTSRAPPMGHKLSIEARGRRAGGRGCRRPERAEAAVRLTNWVAEGRLAKDRHGRSLGRGAVEMLVRGLRLLLGAVHRAFLVLGRPVERVELERLFARVDDVVTGAGRDQRRPVALDAGAVAIDDDLALAFLHPDELVDLLVHLLADLTSRRERHQHELQVLAGVEDAAEILVLLGQLFDIPDEALLHLALLSSFPRLE